MKDVPKPTHRRGDVIELVPPYTSDDLYGFGADIVYKAAKNHLGWAAVKVRSGNRWTGALTMAVVSFDGFWCHLVADWYLVPTVGVPVRVFMEGQKYSVVTTYLWRQEVWRREEHEGSLLRLELFCTLT